MDDLTKKHVALSNIYTPKELEAVDTHQKEELAELDMALALTKCSTFLVGGNSYLRFQGDLLSDSLRTLIGGLGWTAHQIVRAKEAEDIIKKMNNQNFYLEDGKLKALDRNGDFPDIFPQGEPEKWPRTLTFTGNSSLTSPAAFAQNMLNSSLIADTILDEKCEVTSPNAAALTGKTVVVGSYSSKNTVFTNIDSNVERYHAIRDSNGASLAHVDKVSVMQAQFLLNLISVKKDGVPVTDHNRPLIRKDSAEILKRVVGYGYSGSATKNHDAVRILREMITKSALMVETDGIPHPTGPEDAQIVSGITLIAAGGPNLTFTHHHIEEPRCISYVSENDVGASFAGNKIFADANARKVATDPKILHGHSEEGYIAAIKKERANKHIIATPQLI